MAEPLSRSALRKLSLCFAGRDILDATGAPIGGVEAGVYQAAEGGERPVACASDGAVLNRIEVNVIHVLGTVGVAPDGMLPEPALPDGPLTTGDARRGASLRGRNGANKSDLDRLDAVREVVVTLGQRDDAVHVIG
jgi:hypothetical protein